MKSILLVRHAKSSWDDLSMADFDRPLNDRGKRDAPAMAERLAGRNIEIDAFVSSPAKRARKTAEIFSKSLGQHKKDVEFRQELYEASEANFAQVVPPCRRKLRWLPSFPTTRGLQITPIHLQPLALIISQRLEFSP